MSLLSANLHAKSWSNPVATKLAWDLFQQPAIPVKNDKNKKKNATIYKATTDLAMSEMQRKNNCRFFEPVKIDSY